MKTLRTLLAVVALSLGSVVSQAAVIFETGPYADAGPASPGLGPGHVINVTADIELTQIGFMIAGSGDAKFFVMNSDATEFLATSIVAFNEETLAWVYSDPFSFLLEAGNSYVVGVLISSAENWQFGYFSPIAPFSQNGISSSGEARFLLGYDEPVDVGSFGLALPFQLISDPASGEVPEPATYFAVGLGLGLIALYRRRQSQN